MALWVLLNACGYVYVSVATCEREDPLSARDMKEGKCFENPQLTLNVID